jgi:ArsR family transcriptional regulator
MKYQVNQLIDVLKALSDKTRLRIIWVLQKADCELCVCEIIDSLDESQYNVSRHLKVLKTSGLVKENKQGRWVFYSLSKSAEKVYKSLIQLVATLSEDELLKDAKRLTKRLSIRKNGKCIIGMHDK